MSEDANCPACGYIGKGVDFAYHGCLSVLRQRIATLEAEKAERERELAAVKSVLHDEIDANLAFRDACGASDDEDMPTFCARIVFELRELRTGMAERERQEPIGAIDRWPAVAMFSKQIPVEGTLLYAHPFALREPTEDECAVIYETFAAGWHETLADKGRAMLNAVREVMTK